MRWLIEIIDVLEAMLPRLWPKIIPCLEAVIRFLAEGAEHLMAYFSQSGGVGVVRVSRVLENLGGAGRRRDIAVRTVRLRGLENAASTIICVGRDDRRDVRCRASAALGCRHFRCHVVPEFNQHNQGHSVAWRDLLRRTGCRELEEGQLCSQ